MYVSEMSGWNHYPYEHTHCGELGGNTLKEFTQVRVEGLHTLNGASLCLSLCSKETSVNFCGPMSRD